MKKENFTTKIISLTLSLFLIFSAGGYVFIYQQLISLNRFYIHAAIDEDDFDKDIIILSFMKSDIESGNIDFQWMHKKEFRYHGKMYDIVERAETKDSIYFYVYCDDTEDLLVSNFNRHFDDDKKNKKQNSPASNIKIPVSDLFCNSQNGFPLLKYRNYFPPFIESSYSFTELEVPTPPPKSAA